MQKADLNRLTTNFLDVEIITCLKQCFRLLIEIEAVY